MSTYPLRYLTRQLRRLTRHPLLAALLIFLVVFSFYAALFERSIPNADHEATLERHMLTPPSSKPPQPQAQPQQQPSPTVAAPDIPKRLHHYFGDLTRIPERLTKAVNSWANNHNSFEVYFWDSRYLETRLLPNLQLYQRYRNCYRAERHTVGKLLILLTLGGVLIDPDLISLADFNIFTNGSTCVASQELPEVAALLYGLDTLPSLRFAACRPRHPFLQLLLDRFCAGSGAAARAPIRPAISGIDAAAVATASMFKAAFDDAVSAYDDECASRVCDYRERIVLADPGVFLPVVPTRLRDQLLDFCKALQQEERPRDAARSGLRQQACRSLNDPTNRNLPGRMALARQLDPPDDSSDVPSVRLDRIERSIGRMPMLNIDLEIPPQQLSNKIAHF